MNELWTHITVRVPRRHADVVGLALIEAGAGGVEVDDPVAEPPPGVEVWVGGRREQEVEDRITAQRTKEEPDDLLTLKAIYPPERSQEPERQVRQELSRLTFAKDVDIEVGQVPAQDWEQAWKEGFHTIKVSPRLVIRPAWEEYQAATGDEQVVTIDPGLAFGTGTHPTTLLCLRLLDEVVRPGDEVLDAGTGSAILAIAAARLGATRVLGVDADPLAIKAARQNIALNGTGDRVSVQLSDISTVLPRLPSAAGPGSGRTWDGICFNISTDFILAHLAAMYRLSRRWTIISGYPEHRRDEVITGLARAGWPTGSITDRVQDGWGAALALKSQVGRHPGPRPASEAP